MGLFRCKHYIPIDKMEDVSVEADNVGEFLLHYGARVKYKGFCRECNAYVSLTEEITNRALYVYLESLKPKKVPECPSDDSV